jgi:hypothetical protein
VCECGDEVKNVTNSVSVAGDSVMPAEIIKEIGHTRTCLLTSFVQGKAKF